MEMEDTMRVLLTICVLAGCATTGSNEIKDTLSMQVRPTPPRVQAIANALVRELPEQHEPIPVIIFRESRSGQDIPLFFYNTSNHRIYVREDLLKQFISKPDLAAVFLGHEIGHAAQFHGWNEPLFGIWVPASIGSGVGVGLAATWWAGLLTGFGVFLSVPLIAHDVIRSQESEADLIGLELTRRAGFNVRRGVEFACQFFAVVDLFDRVTGGDPESWLETHPSGQERCDTMRDALKEQRFGSR